MYICDDTLESFMLELFDHKGEATVSNGLEEPREFTDIVVPWCICAQALSLDLVSRDGKLYKITDRGIRFVVHEYPEREDTAVAMLL